MNKALTFFLVVQGEGRGHMTQAIAMNDMLIRNGYEVCCVLVGKSKQREIPQFFTDKFKCEVLPLESPNFVTDAKMKSVKMFSSVVKNIKKIRTFKKSVSFIHQKIQEHNPDIIINFYDPLISIYNFFYSPKAMFVSIAHQNIFLHKKYKFPKGYFFDRIGLINYTKLNSLNAKLRLALSFYPLEEVKRKKIIVVPPLLRKEVFEKQTQLGNYILVYLVNHGYLENVINWHKQNSSIVLHCFTDRKSEKETEEIQANLFLHKLNDTKFLEMMAEAGGLVSTAGFESVGECMYFGKPALLVPIEGHYEQYCNAHDANYAGNILHDSEFKLERLISHMKDYDFKNDEYKNWVASAEKIIMEAIENAYDIKMARIISYA